MFSPDIVSADAFLDMPVSSQVLYFHLSLRADDDGFVTPKMVMRLLGSGDDDLKVLIVKRFVLPFESGVVVVKHWLIHNLIRADLYKETTYKKEKATLGLNEYGAYTELREGVTELKEIEPPEWLKIRRGEPRTAHVPFTALRLGKVRLGKDSKETTKVSVSKNTFGEFTNVSLAVEEYQKLADRYGRSATKQLIEELSTYSQSSGKKYKDHYATLLNWAKRKGLAEVRADMKPKPPEVEQTPEEVEATKKRLEKMRNELGTAFRL